jgi:hypothetical protein
VSAQTKNSVPRAEYDRMWRVMDQSLTAHSILRDRYRLRDRSLTLAVVTLSIVATAFAFLSGDLIVHLGRTAIKLPAILGVLTATIFFLTLAETIVGWRRRAWSHEHAVHALAELKATMRGATKDGDVVSTGHVDISALYQRTMASLPEIPESKFLILKARHHRKVLISKLIDTHKGAPLIYVRGLAFIHGLRGDRAASTKVANATEDLEEPPI